MRKLEERERAPIYEMLERHAGLHATAFHVPGHKQRADWGHEAAERRFGPLLPIDLTELADTDDLHHPTGAIQEAQKLAADCFGAEETRFLVGGSTAGNLAMILGIAAPGDLLLVQRNVHRSVVHGLMVAGVRAVFLPPAVDRLSGLAVIPEPGVIGHAVTRYPEAKGLILSSPNYYGLCGDLTPLVDICHAAGIPVLVDEAHGPHFGFHPLFPPSALQAGVDVVVQSAHKILSAMTMCALLHMQGSLVAREPVRQALRMVQSSSPSFPLLASLDLARRQLHMEGQAAFTPALQAISAVREQLPRTAFRALEPAAGSASTTVRQDLLKMVLYDANGQLGGFRIRDELSARGCFAEMADSRFAVIAFGIGSRAEDGEALAVALADISNRLPMAPVAVSSQMLSVTDTERIATDPVVPEPMNMSRGFQETESVRLEESLGRTAGEWVVPYPPGIPELFPGERITQNILQKLEGWRQRGALIQGAEDPSLASVRVWTT